MAASRNRNMPDAPIGLDDSTPPEAFQGMSPPSSEVAPSSVSFHPSPSGAKPRLSIHIGSYHENGTYTSATWISRRGSVMPAWRYTSAAQSVDALGLTWSRPANMVGSERMAMPCTHAGGCDADDESATRSDASTMAAAPSEDGHVSRYRMGSHSM